MTRKEGAEAKSKFPPGRKPHFFKVLLGDFAQELRIPPEFLKHMEGKARGRVTLQGPNGNKRWHVELGTRSQGTFLLRGWPNFVEHHLLKEHDFLIFRYEGKKHFSVLVYDKSGCEKDYMVFCETSEEKDIKSEGVHLSSVPSQKVKVKTKEFIDIPTVISLERSKCNNHRQRPKRKVVTDGERERAQTAVHSFRSRFPFFISCMKAYFMKSCTMRVPAIFSRKYLAQDKVKLVLRDPKGMAWVVLFINGNLSAGWRAFTRGNNLEEGDYCAFELVRPTELRTHIFKAVQNSTPGRWRPT